ncbi:hypothetical protein AB835_04235 [Candidatus Endobugula sertula]|uniref:PilZ domain-containing protein n=1 Tax=Candidatus Endobugula sertula TaxID=62101 RepID=A0A1D2QS21_9GAMM|nr:hypothetical protein AB835_04235 [Candidatus Endobugula sertula]
MKSDTNNRRRFFRIVDSMGVAYRVLTDDECSLEEVRQDIEFINANNLMDNYNVLIQEALDGLQTRDPQAATAIGQLNQKVDAMLMMLELDSLMVQQVPQRIAQASISASGIAFPVDEELVSETKLSLDLILKPSSQHINAIGKVVSCESLNESLQYYLRVEFIEMSNKDREILIQHIVQRQGALLRTLKSEMDDE